MRLTETLRLLLLANLQALDMILSVEQITPFLKFLLSHPVRVSYTSVECVIPFETTIIERTEEAQTRLVAHVSSALQTQNPVRSTSNL